MKFCRIIFFASIFLLFSQFLFSQNNPVIIIAINAWEPLKYETAPFGVLAQITKEAFALEDIDVDFQIAPWKRGYDYVLTGQWHGIVGWNRTAEREKLFYVSSPVLLEDVVFFHRKDLKLEWQTVEDLKGLSAGAIAGYNYGSEFQRAIESGIIKKEITSNEELSIKMLQNKRFDIWPCEVDVGLFLIKKYLPPEAASQITYSQNPIQISDLCLLLSRKKPENAAYLIRFERGLKTLKETGRYEDIIEEMLPR
ncbi:MAG: transporter substrate-binding domain-containing protein [Spirochaetaceae bacterium]|jgi:polar amino acid transport system substrate-binding protein|nr:transporter substrate-binding domain-containing protein [Spirochaetaceae bacterium]